MPAKVEVYQEVPELERRISELQSQIEGLSASLRLWREPSDHLQPMESRLSQLTEQCAEIVERWSVTGERQAQAVGELEQQLIVWNSREMRAEQNASARMQELRRIIEQEWTALRQIHEEPVKQLREQAASLTEVCAATATSAVTSFDRAEARLAALETGLHRRLTELSDQLRSAVAEFRSLASQAPRALAGPDPSWPLDGVVRLHNQLRESSDVNDPSRRPVRGEARAQLPETGAAALSERIDTLEHALADGQSELHQAAERINRAGRRWWIAVILVAIGVGLTGVLLTRLQRQVNLSAARAAEAEHQAQAAAQAANQRIGAARDDAARQIAEARGAALKAQTMSDVLAAPDLVRFNLVGGNETAKFGAQVLWSRSRGLVFSASRLPPPPKGSTYQIWLVTSAEPVSVGLFNPDAAGRFSLATDAPPRVPRPISGVVVTVESAGGRELPSGPTLLARAQ
jgi:Anti-sigma-K factor rskA, C-terminal